MPQIIEENVRKPHADWGKALSGLAQQYGKYQQGKRQQAQQLAAAEQLGLDPSVFSLPEQAQAEYFKNAFATEKGPTPLQESQMKLNEEKLNALKGRQQLFQRLSSGQEGQVQAGTEQEQNVLSSMSENNLSQLAAFAGQPGEEGVIGNIAKAEKDRRDKESKAKLEEEKVDYQSFKDQKDYTEKVLNGYEGYKRDKNVLDAMEKIAKSGKLSTPMTVATLNKLGIPLGVLNNPESEQFDKLSVELLKNIQNTFGSRILQSEVQQFMKSIPTLLNSPEGQKKLIKQWQILNEGKKIYYDAYKDIKKKNPKRLPPDLHERVLEEAEPKLDLLSDEFRKMNAPKQQLRTPDGQIIEVPDDEIEEAMSLGAMPL